MNENYNVRKMIEILMDPDISIILSELENGGKESSSYLAEKLQISDTEIKERLSYVIQQGFVKINQDENKTVFTADNEKLNKIMETNENF